MLLKNLLAASLALAAFSAPPAAGAADLGYYDFCAGSPLAVGSVLSEGGTVTDIHVVADANGKAVGWIYATSAGTSYLQANGQMRPDDQQQLRALAHEAVSTLRPKPHGLPPDLAVRACRASEIARF